MMIEEFQQLSFKAIDQARSYKSAQAVPAISANKTPTQETRQLNRLLKGPPLGKDPLDFAREI